ncbi:hypothetical protein NPIL_521881 [Nephila pilipes]|uniref:Uncharacterized protein n=1 Tax=Nephila pilipes TaxID=299642 RepID=A0A8X6MZW6_NEPPI|nr:hypothetical protein NPIL_521881 [Nephila pilipes]
MGHLFFFVIEAESKRHEIYSLKKTPDTLSTIDFLREILNRHELPKILFNNIASIFKSQERINFCKRKGIPQKESGLPQDNKWKSRTILPNIKKKLKCRRFQLGILHEQFCALLFQSRVTPLYCGKTYAGLLYGENMRTKLGCILASTNQYLQE